VRLGLEVFGFLVDSFFHGDGVDWRVG
jgi:hypothetical protein